MANRKLVMEEHEGKVLVGVQQEGCDPVVKTVEGNLDAALAQVPEMLTEAQEKWATSPKMPAYKPPAEPKPAAAPAQKAESLPLLQGEEKPKAEEVAPAPEEAPAEAPVEAPAEVEPEVVAAELKSRLLKPRYRQPSSCMPLKKRELRRRPRLRIWLR
ncbi:hypothetical protein ES703_41420 [subsurface metagenome]